VIIEVEDVMSGAVEKLLSPPPEKTHPYSRDSGSATAGGLPRAWSRIAFVLRTPYSLQTVGLTERDPRECCANTEDGNTLVGPPRYARGIAMHCVQGLWLVDLKEATVRVDTPLADG